MLQDIKKQYILQGLPITDIACSEALFLDISGKGFHGMLFQSPFGRGLPPRNVLADNHCASALRKLLFEPLRYFHQPQRIMIPIIVIRVDGFMKPLSAPTSMRMRFEATSFLSVTYAELLFRITSRHLIPRIPLTNLPHKASIDLALEILRQFVPASLSKALLFPQPRYPQTTGTPPEACTGKNFSALRTRF